MKEAIYNIINDMVEYLDVSQMKRLHEVLIKRLTESQKEEVKIIDNCEYMNMFLAAKKIEGCSKRTLQFYRVTIEKMLSMVEIPLQKMTTEVLRKYLADYQNLNNCSKVTIDNIRRNLSSFFSWLEEEDYILKSPMRRIHKIKTGTIVKEIISDESMEKLRDHCKEARDLAMIDLLFSTGIRVGELVNLDISDINFEARECVVYGKGDKERKVYFDARTKVHLQSYLKQRTDQNAALFVTLSKPYKRLKISGVEIRLRKMGRILNIERIHPHKFRRTVATRAIDRGMPIEQVQKLLGHSQIDTTMQYAMVNQDNVKNSHKKYIAS
ncbi:MAG: tyrosine-type recombinase/integrase [Anaerostipes sp.]|uniref:site-specific tyrosine recombinase/integron integrase n=1 Tax=Anaerostipes sp. 992a TaxID=1261637 RepID=UPI000952B4F3|nr:site-specific tyrosine recombinase/integron integrase [Anaerostipes sp. 992a]MCI5952133.1 tyrosine-type recombinase/integrase [Anaerostipes sp.]OLR58073.1 integrase [Anaerostipes sp. 992a]